VFFNLLQHYLNQLLNFPVRGLICFCKGAMIRIYDPILIIQSMMKLYEWRLYNCCIETNGKRYFCRMNKRWLSYENIWARNILFGLFLVAIVFLQNEFSSQPETKDSVATLLWQFLLMYAVLFSFNHLILRKLLLTRKYFLFFISTVLYIFLFAVVAGWLQNKSETQLSFTGQLLGAFSILFISSAIFLAHTGIQSSIVKNKIKLLQKDSELIFLKQQLSPHFLYNALNNLYGTALSAPELVADKIVELSALLRYQVEATSKNFVSINEERTFLENYINYQVYKTNNLAISNTTVGEIRNFQVPPLLFLPLFENAIKFAGETEKAFVNIVWTFGRNSVSFCIENSFLESASKLNGTKTGLENLRKRLDLLNIKNKLTTGQQVQNLYKSELVLWELSINAW
jgi:sensor histidine kinase YesM